MSKTETPTPIVANVVKYPVYPQGIYQCAITEIKVIERTPYGKENSDEKENAIRFEFTAFSKNNETGKNEPLYLPDIDAERPVNFNIVTGMNFGGKKASLTKLINSIVGRPVTTDEMKTVNIAALSGQHMELLISEEPTDSGEIKNKIQSVKRISKEVLDLTKVQI